MKIKWQINRAKHLRLGERGERLAVELVRSLGLEVVTTNFRIVGGEIDIIAWDGSQLCFIEVKTRRNNRFLGSPADAVGFKKRQRLAKAAKAYLFRIPAKSICYRFDVIAISFEGAVLSEIRWLTDYFKAYELREKYDKFDYE
ncbi:MAG: YraN family protein [Lentisphaeria bacterium]|nr:YraN family protein [Lentisphaeria bacterium]